MFKSAPRNADPTPSTPDDAVKHALLGVVQLWLDRLQSLTTVSTFFVSIDSLLYTAAASTRHPNVPTWSKTEETINASLAGAIIFHVSASAIAYIGAYIVVRYRLVSAEERIPAPSLAPANPPLQRMRFAPAPSAFTDPPRPIAYAYTDVRASLVTVHRSFPLQFLRLFSSRRKEPARMRGKEREGGQGDPEASESAVAPDTTLESLVMVLTRCHAVSAALSSAGFVLALVGFLTYCWTAVPMSLGIFATVCFGVSLVAALVALK